MAQSLAKRLNGNEAEFLEDVRLHGRIKALDLWSERIGGYHDIIGLCKFLYEKTGDENYGLYPQFDTHSDKTRYTDLVQEFADFVFKMRTLLAEKDKQIAQMKKEIELLKSRECLEIAGLIEELKK